MTKKIYFDDIKIGDAMPAFASAPITRTNLVRYAGASGDFNPLHHDETFVALFGMQRVIAQGMFIMGITSNAITQWIDNKYLRNFKVRFSGMTEPADLTDFENTKTRATITVTGEVVKKFAEGGENLIQCDITAMDALGSVKLTGSFIAALPSK
ncbi:MAG: MaoC/PaaZ C-terminal domain-containing protein [Smithella sp.]|nr:MaoC/PaaZ C-terminal domain-containing protein [Smithella sp.]